MFVPRFAFSTFLAVASAGSMPAEEVTFWLQNRTGRAFEVWTHGRLGRVVGKANAKALRHKLTVEDGTTHGLRAVWRTPTEREFGCSVYASPNVGGLDPAAPVYRLPYDALCRKPDYVPHALPMEGRDLGDWEVVEFGPRPSAPAHPGEVPAAQPAAPAAAAAAAPGPAPSPVPMAFGLNLLATSALRLGPVPAPMPQPALGGPLPPAAPPAPDAPSIHGDGARASRTPGRARGTTLPAADRHGDFCEIRFEVVGCGRTLTVWDAPFAWRCPKLSSLEPGKTGSGIPDEPRSIKDAWSKVEGRSYPANAWQCFLEPGRRYALRIDGKTKIAKEEDESTHKRKYLTRVLALSNPLNPSDWKRVSLVASKKRMRRASSLKAQESWNIDLREHDGRTTVRRISNNVLGITLGDPDGAEGTQDQEFRAQSLVSCLPLTLKPAGPGPRLPASAMGGVPAALLPEPATVPAVPGMKRTFISLPVTGAPDPQDGPGKRARTSAPEIKVINRSREFHYLRVDTAAPTLNGVEILGVNPTCRISGKAWQPGLAGSGSGSASAFSFVAVAPGESIRLGMDLDEPAQRAIHLHGPGGEASGVRLAAVPGGEEWTLQKRVGDPDRPFPGLVVMGWLIIDSLFTSPLYDVGTWQDMVKRVPVDDPDRKDDPKDLVRQDMRSGSFGT